MLALFLFRDANLLRNDGIARFPCENIDSSDLSKSEEVISWSMVIFQVHVLYTPRSNNVVPCVL